jgi:hypothetical protein
MAVRVKKYISCLKRSLYNRQQTTGVKIMSQDNHRLSKTAALAALAGLASSVGMVTPAQATIHEVSGKIASLRAASPAQASGSLLNKAVQHRDQVHANAVTFGQFGQSFGQSFGQFGQSGGGLNQNEDFD